MLVDFKNPVIWKVDSSKLSTFQTCRRLDFYTHVLGWRVEESRGNDLSFGTAWHKAMESALLGHSFEESYEAFFREYRKDNPASTDEDNKPKNPDRAHYALRKFFDGPLSRFERMKILHTEVAGSVPTWDEERMFFRMDAIAEDESGVIFVDHKTTKYNSSTWADRYRLSNAVFTYQHALDLVYGPDKVRGGLYVATVFQMRECFFLFAPVFHSPEMKRVWLQELHDLQMARKSELATLQEELALGLPMRSFPRNFSACVKYHTCPFLSFCSSWPDPLKRVGEEPPSGFRKELWDPEAYQSDAKVMLKPEVPSGLQI